MNQSATLTLRSFGDELLFKECTASFGFAPYKFVLLTSKHLFFFFWNKQEGLWSKEVMKNKILQQSILPLRKPLQEFR
jgi:hypothetical protein